MVWYDGAGDEATEPAVSGDPGRYVCSVKGVCTANVYLRGSQV